MFAVAKGPYDPIGREIAMKIARLEQSAKIHVQALIILYTIFDRKETLFTYFY